MKPFELGYCQGNRRLRFRYNSYKDYEVRRPICTPLTECWIHPRYPKRRQFLKALVRTMGHVDTRLIIIKPNLILKRNAPNGVLGSTLFNYISISFFFHYETKTSFFFVSLSSVLTWVLMSRIRAIILTHTLQIKPESLNLEIHHHNLHLEPCSVTYLQIVLKLVSPMTSMYSLKLVSRFELKLSKSSPAV